MRRPRRDRLGIAVCLEGLAAADAAMGQWSRAVRLLAAALREAIGAPLPPAEWPHCERTGAAAREALGPERFTAARTAGRAMATDEAVAHALEEAG